MEFKFGFPDDREPDSGYSESGFSSLNDSEFSGKGFVPGEDESPVDSFYKQSSINPKKMKHSDLDRMGEELGIKFRKNDTKEAKVKRIKAEYAKYEQILKVEGEESSLSRNQGAEKIDFDKIPSVEISPSMNYRDIPYPEEFQTSEEIDTALESMKNDPSNYIQSGKRFRSRAQYVYQGLEIRRSQILDRLAKQKRQQQKNKEADEKRKKNFQSSKQKRERDESARNSTKKKPTPKPESVTTDSIEDQPLFDEDMQARIRKEAAEFRAKQSAPGADPSLPGTTAKPFVYPTAESYESEPEEDTSFDPEAIMEEFRRNEESGFGNMSQEEIDADYEKFEESRRSSPDAPGSTQTGSGDPGGQNTPPSGSGGTGEPPRKPPAPPSGDEPDTPDPDDGREIEVTPETAQKDVLDKTNKDFADLKRRLAADKRRAAKQRARDKALKRKELKSQSQQARDEIETSSANSSSDRLIRRLGTFGIARSIGGSGQLFASLMELFVFGPEEAKAQEEEKARREQIKNSEIESLNRFDEEVFNSDLTSIDREEEIKQKIADAQDRLKKTNDVNERRDIIKGLQDDLYPSGPVSDEEPIEAKLAGQEEPTKSLNTDSPSDSVSGEGSKDPIKTPSPKSSSGPEPTKDPVKDGIGGIGSNLTGTTKAILGANIALEALSIASKTASQNIDRAGKVFAADNQEAGKVAISEGSNAIKDAAGVGSALAGAGAGFAVGGPVGAALGAALGKGLSDSVAGPIISSIEAGNALLESFVKDTIAPETLGASIEQQILTELQQMESSFNVDSITADFVEANGGLNRAIIELKEELIGEFGGNITEIVKAATTIVKVLGQLVEYGGVITEVMIKNLPVWVQNLIGIAVGTLDKLADIEDATKTIEELVNKNDATAFEQEIKDFFDSQKQFNNVGNFNNTLGFF